MVGILSGPFRCGCYPVNLLCAIALLRPGVDFADTNGTLAGIRWDTPGVTPPTQTEVDAKMLEPTTGIPANATPFRICCSATVPAWSTKVYTGLPAFSLLCWNFPRTVPAGNEFWITDLEFSSKKVRDPRDPLNMRSSYAVFNSITTLTEHKPFVSYRCPIRMPAGFVINGAFMNNSTEEQNMIAGMHGYVVPLAA